MSRGPDIIRWIIDRMLAHEDSITQELALTVEREARIEWGGQRIDYVAKHCQADVEARRKSAVRSYIDGQSFDQIQGATGVSRSALYRSLKKR